MRTPHSRTAAQPHNGHNTHNAQDWLLPEVFQCDEFYDRLEQVNLWFNSGDTVVSE